MAADWPGKQDTSLTTLRNKILEAVVELEETFENGGPIGDTSSHGPVYEPRLGPFLQDAYSKLSISNPGPLRPLRASSVSTLLAQLEHDLSPKRIANASVARRAFPQAEGEVNAVGALGGGQIIEAYFGDPTSVVSLRLDQMLSARFWGIGFCFESEELNTEWIDILVRSATRRLAADLLSLEMVLGQLKNVQSVKIVPEVSERGFEHIVLDILNEDASRARLAPLAEDILEKTDLRVSYPHIKRKRGARVQVTSITDPSLHQAKLDAIRRNEEIVFLSPLTLAWFAFEEESAGVLKGALGVPHDHAIADVALDLKGTLLRASLSAPDTPLGPLAIVPAPIRELVRRFVETRSSISTDKLRMRQSEQDKWP